MAQEIYMDCFEIEALAEDHDFGRVHWESKIALNTGKPMEVGYVFINGQRLLFCKKGSINPGFYLCNDFRRINGTD